MSNNCSKNRSQPQQHSQAGFTLIELLVVCAVTGFIVLAATGIMVSFTKIKYSADVQVQLKTEATFAANQIDLLIRNSSGIPDLCISQYRDSSGNPQYCSGDYRQDFNPSGNVTCDVNKLTPEELTTCWGYSTSQCIYTPVAPYPDGTPEDIFTSYNDGSGIKYTSIGEKNSGIAPDLLYRKGYRYNLPGVGEGSFEANKNYLIVQNARLESSKKPPSTQPASTFFDMNLAENSSNICNYGSGGSIRTTCQDLRTVYYHQILSIKSPSAGNSNPQLTVSEFPIGTQLNPSNSSTVTNTPERLFANARELAQSNFTSYPKTVTTMYLTSQSVRAEALTFECTLRNYGLPTQAAAVKYTLTLTIPKESYNSQYEELDEQLYDGSSTPLSQRDSYESYSLTRLVTVRNGSQPFRYTQNN